MRREGRSSQLVQARASSVEDIWSDDVITIFLDPERHVLLTSPLPNAFRTNAM